MLSMHAALGYFDRLLYEQIRVGSPVASMFREGMASDDLRIKLLALPGKLANEVQQLYLWRNGISNSYLNPVFPDGVFAPLEEKLEQYSEIIADAQQYGGAATEVWNPNWFPIFTTLSGDLYVTLCRDTEQREAPVFFIPLEDKSEIFLAYDSLSTMAVTLAECYRTGAYHRSEHDEIVEDRRSVADIIRQHNPKRLEGALNLVPGAHSVNEIVAQVTDSKPGVRAAARRALVIIGDRSAEAPLVDLLRIYLISKMADPGIKRGIIEVLRHLQASLISLPVLLEALRDADSIVRGIAAATLGDIGDSRALEPLVLMLGNRDYRDRVAAARALGAIGDIKAGGALRDLASDKDAAVRWAAAWALGRLKDSKAIVLLADLLSDEYYKVRYDAAASLGDIGDSGVTDIIVKTLDGADDQMRTVIARALGKIGGSKAISALVNLLEDNDFIVRQTTVQALATIGDASVVGSIVDAMSDESPYVREAAASALGCVQNDISIAALSEGLSDAVPSVRFAAVGSLGEIKTPESIAILIGAVHDAVPSIRARAAMTLGGVGSAEARDALVSLEHDPDPVVRRCVAESMDLQ